VESALLLDVIIRKGATILELFTSEDEALLVRRDTLLVLDLSLHVVDRIGRLDLECDGLAGQRFHKNLHPATKTEDEVESRLLLDVVIRKSAAVLELLAGEDEALLIGRDPFLILDLRLDVVDRVRRLDLESDCFAGESFDEYLHPAAQTKNEVKSRLLLDVIVRKSTTVFKLLSGEDQTLLVGRDPFLVLDLRLDVIYSVR